MDKETIIKGCENWVNNHKDENLLLAYSSVVKLLAVLKEQEYAKPVLTEPIMFGTNRKCSNCDKYLFPACKFCSHCGRQVKWND
jgi:hypothetical protein